MKFTKKIIYKYLKYNFDLYKNKPLLFRTLKNNLDVKDEKHKSPMTIGRRVALLPGASPGSIGDEAMVRAMLEELESRGFEVVPIGFYLGDRWEFMVDPVGVLPRTIKEWELFIPVLAQFDHVFVNGADNLDGGYGIQNALIRINLAYVANLLNIPATVTGFSLNKSCPRIICEALSGLSKLTAIYPRDPQAKLRLDEISGEPHEQVADLAFLMKPDLDYLEKADCIAWIKSRKTQERLVAAINICPQTFEVNSKDSSKHPAEELLDIYEVGIKLFMNKYPNVDVVLIPHDYRRLLGDLNLSLILCDRLKQEINSDRIYLVDDRCKANEIKAIASAVDFAFSGRMHFSIACLGVSTPIGCFVYQDKFEGLFELFGLDKSLLIEVENSDGIDLFNLLAVLLEKRAEIKQIIEIKLPEIKLLSKRNFNFLYSNSISN